MANNFEPTYKILHDLFYQYGYERKSFVSYSSEGTLVGLRGELQPGAEYTLPDNGGIAIGLVFSHRDISGAGRVESPEAFLTHLKLLFGDKLHGNIIKKPDTPRINIYFIVDIRS